MENVSAPTPVEPEFAAWLALDWADQKHRWMLQAAAGGSVQKGEVDSRPEDIHHWITQLIQQFGGKPIAVCLEQRRGPLIYQLSVYPELILYPVATQTAGKYREAWYPSGAKNDPIDTDLLLEIVQKHRNRLRPLQPDDLPTRKLRFLVEQRRHQVEERTRHCQQLTDQLKQYFPQILRWFSDPISPVVCALLEQWPTLEQLQAQPDPSLRAFLVQHGLRAPRIDTVMGELRQALPVTRDAAILDSCVLAVRGQLRVLTALRANISELEKRCREQTQAHPDYPIFASLPGAGEALEPRLIVAFGSDRQRYANASELATFSGIAPVGKQSGKMRVVYFRRACPKFLRQSLHEWAAQTISRSTWARAYYQQQRSQQKDHHAAVRALAFKWIRILYRCWKDKVPYNEKIYMTALQRRGSPLAEPVKIQLKKVAGFWKLSQETT